MSEKKIYQILELCLWLLIPFMFVLAIFDQQMQAGVFLQWTGKLHPLALHFPIVFGLLTGIYLLFFPLRRLPLDTEKLLLAINALFACGVAILGILLSKQNAYDGELVNLHKWGGIAVSVISFAFLFVLNLSVRFKRILAGAFVLVLIGSTHKGAQLTHGINALSFPKTAASSTGKELSDTTATIYEAGIAPILAQKCVGCHGEDKMKGDLQLHTPEKILLGGKNGNILKGNLTAEAGLLQRIHLPITDEKHMPPDGKLQLTSEETSILSKWIKSGASFETRLNAMAKEDSLFLLVNKLRSASSQKLVQKTDLPDLEEFNSNYCTTNYLYFGSDEVEVNFFQGSFYKRENLKKLEKIKDKIVSLNMQGMPLAKEDMDILIQFNNLQKVNLNSTGLNISNLESLKSLPKLKAVSICGIKFDEAELDRFLDQATFSSLNVWSDGVSEKQLQKLISKYPSIKFNVGDNMENVTMKMSNPVIEQDSSIISAHLDVKIKHLLKGVVIRYTADGSDPDSLKSTEYTKPIRLSANTVLKVKAFKSGWISSDVVQRTFYKSEIHPDTIYLVKTPDQKYRGNGAKTLIDYELGETNMSNGKWLGYRASDMEFIVGFKQPRLLNSVHFNALVDIGAYIFPINSITVQGSNDGIQFTPISKIKFPEANKSDPKRVNTYSCDFPKPTSFKYYKFIASNLKKLPSWHSGIGEPAWIFVDEIFLN
ncbi:MAG: chitobiase/beta-hexosaminidase C-terminal domain-containing protein [Prolixibacteraceae bacterium]|nr:chitobiase/beta-hexosaminidase C-terminal domain-containing protein [Prolixibacteraceae bacterium]